MQKFNKTIIYLFLLFFGISTAVYAVVDIVTSVPDLAAIAKEIGGDKVKVKSLGKGYQNPHYVDAKPSYIVDLNRADFLIYIGLDLEIGWLPVLVTGARNSRINTPNTGGNLDTSTLVPLLDVATVKVNRSQGDIHPGGNPHFLLDPRNALKVASGITKRLGEIDPENKTFYEINLEVFNSSLKQKILGWNAKLEPSRGTKVFTYHELWDYFINWSGLKVAGTIEPKPGIPPSPKHVADLIKIAESSDVRMVISANFYPKKTGEQIAKAADIPFLSLPVQVGGEKGINSYTELIDFIVEGITSNLIKQTAEVSE
jgi:ABC-type Zn uptake system ZnuABC Zn-binding protein ZnuA